MATVDGWRPTHELPEIAFAGRSNVGKSSLLNALVRRKAVARVSKTPGRTRGDQLLLGERRLRARGPPGVRLRAHLQGRDRPSGVP